MVTKDPFTPWEPLESAYSEPEPNDTRTSLVNDPTPSFVFSSSEPGTIAYEGGCSSSVAEAVAGMHAITLTISVMVNIQGVS